MSSSICSSALSASTMVIPSMMASVSELDVWEETETELAESEAPAVSILAGSSITVSASASAGLSSMYDPHVLLRKISDPLVYALVSSMIQVDPRKRHSAKQYLEV